MKKKIENTFLKQKTYMFKKYTFKGSKEIEDMEEQVGQYNT